MEVLGPSRILLKRWTKYLGLATTLFGSLGLFGWKFDYPLLASFRSNYVLMAPLTAILFIIGGSLLLTFTVERLSRAAKLRAVIISILIGSLGLADALSLFLHFNFPLDLSSSCRMSPVAGLGFCLSGLALLLLFIKKRNKIFSNAITILSSAVLICAVAIGVSYLQPPPFLYGTAISPVALPTVLAFCCLGAGLIMAIGEEGYLIRPLVGMNVRSRLLRAFIPLSLLCGIIHVALNVVPRFGMGEVNKAILVDLIFIPVMVAFVSIVSKWIGGIIDQEIVLRRQLENELKTYVDEVIDAQEIERLRIAKEIHEGVIQDLGVIVHELRAAASTNSTLSHMVNSMMTTIDEVRRITHNLRPSILDHLGLSTALQSLCSDLQMRAGIIIEQNIQASPMRVARTSELALFRIAQETLNNIEKHSGATKVTFNYSYCGPEIELVISDNGKGFNQKSPGELRASLKTKSGLGLMHIKERATAIGAKVVFETLQGQGTKIVVRAPIARPDVKEVYDDARNSESLIS